MGLCQGKSTAQTRLSCSYRATATYNTGIVRRPAPPKLNTNGKSSQNAGHGGGYDGGDGYDDLAHTTATNNTGVVLPPPPPKRPASPPVRRTPAVSAFNKSSPLVGSGSSMRLNTNGNSSQPTPSPTVVYSSSSAFDGFSIPQNTSKNCSSGALGTAKDGGHGGGYDGGGYDGDGYDGGGYDGGFD